MQNAPPCEASPNAAVLAAPAETRPFCPQRSRPYVLAAAILASALGFIDGSIVSIAMPAIRADLGASFVDAQWISNAYALTLSALILVGGAAGDRFGLRITFVAGITVFIATSIACALAPSPAWLIAFRALQGMGAAIMVPCSLAIIAKAYPKAERGRAIGIWAAASALTTALGPVLGGFVLSAFDQSVWRAIFAVNLPLGAVAVYLLLAKVPPDRPAERRGLDLAGAALAALGFGALAYGLTAMSGDIWDSALELSLPVIAAGILIIGAFIFWERRQADPMMNIGLFRSRPFSGANVATFFLYFSLSAILFYLPMLLIAGWNVSAADAGFIFLPLSAAIALLSGPVGRVADRIGARAPIALGSLVVGVAFGGLGLLAMAGLHAFWLGVFPLMVLMGLGMALVVSPLSTAVMTSVDDADTGAASGINNAVARIAGLVAVAAMGAVAAVVYDAFLLMHLDAGPVSASFGELVSGLEARAEAARVVANDRAFAAVALSTAILCLLSAVTAWLTLAEPERTVAGR